MPPDPPGMRTPHPANPPDLPPLGASLLRMALRLIAAIALAYGVLQFLDWSMDLAKSLPPGTGLAMETTLIALALLIYALLIAIPFVPGIEIGITLVLLRGADIALAVYLATALGLTIAYLAGRLMPLTWLRRVLADLRLRRACAFLDRIAPMSDAHRVDLLRSALPSRFGNAAITYRYLLLAGLINLPGSGLIGGGGGICLAAGLTHLFRPRITLITIALAVIPFPLTVWLLGPTFLG